MSTKSLEQIAQEAAKECASCAWIYDHGGDYGFDEDNAAKIILAACEKARGIKTTEYAKGWDDHVAAVRAAQPQRSEPCKHHFEADGGPCLACGLTASQLIVAQQPPATDTRLERLQHVTIEAGTDARLFSATYVTPMKIYVKDTLIYDSESHPENDTTLPPI